MQEAPPPPPAPAPEPKKDRKARRREKFGPSLDELIQSEEAQKEFEGGRPASADDLADSETIAQRVFSGREVSEESAEAAAPAEPPETPEPDLEIPHDELRKGFEEALAAALPEDERPSPARAIAEPEPVRRAASKASRPAQPRRDVPKPKGDAARDVEVTGISAPTEELAAAGVTQEELAAHHRERIAEMQRMNPGWESSTGLGAAAKTERAGERRPKTPPEAASVEPAKKKPGETSPRRSGRSDEAPEAEALFSRYYEALKASGAKGVAPKIRDLRRSLRDASPEEIEKVLRGKIESHVGGSSPAAKPRAERDATPEKIEGEVTGVSAPTEALAAAGVTRADLEAGHRERIAEMQRLNPGWKSATGLDAGQSAESGAAAAEVAPGKKSKRKASVVWSATDDSAARLAEHRLEKRGLRGAELASALPAERRRRADAMRETAGANATTEAAPSAQVGGARKKRQPILQNVPDAPSPTAAPQPIEPEVLARDAASIRKQRDVAATEIRAARGEWKAEAGGEARVDALAALDKKIEEKRRRAPKKDDGENVRAAVSSVADAARNRKGPGAAAEAGLTEPGSFENFYAVLRARTPAVVGSAQEYSADDIIEIVEGVRRGDLTPEHLTRTFGIRETAMRLIEAERLEKARAALGLSAAPAASPATAIAGAPSSVEGVTEDDYRAALETVFAEKKASTSLLQRRLGLGYEKSRALLDELARRGVISDPGGALPRAILMSQAEAEATMAKPQTTATSPSAAARPRLVAAGGGAGGGAGTPPPPAGGPANVPPAPGGRRGVVIAQTPATPPRAAAAPAMGIFARMGQRVGQLGVGAVGAFNQGVVRPMSWLWKKAERPGSYNTKEAPFKNQTSIFYPITGSIGALWKIIGGWFGAKFETPKEEKKK